MQCTRVPGFEVISMLQFVRVVRRVEGGGTHNKIFIWSSHPSSTVCATTNKTTADEAVVLHTVCERQMEKGVGETGCFPVEEGIGNREVSNAQRFACSHPCLPAGVLHRGGDILFLVRQHCRTGKCSCSVTQNKTTADEAVVLRFWNDEVRSEHSMIMLIPICRIRMRLRSHVFDDVRHHPGL